MIHVYADFNDATADDAYWILLHEGTPLRDKAAALGLTPGDTVVLFQDADDFEVRATLGFEMVGLLGREEWVARPDWSTLVRLKSEAAAE